MVSPPTTAKDKTTTTPKTEAAVISHVGIIIVIFP